MQKYSLVPILPERLLVTSLETVHVILVM